MTLLLGPHTPLFCLTPNRAGLCPSLSLPYCPFELKEPIIPSSSKIFAFAVTSARTEKTLNVHSHLSLPPESLMTWSLLSMIAFTTLCTSSSQRFAFI